MYVSFETPPYLPAAHYLGQYGYKAGEKDKCSIAGVPLNCVMSDDRSLMDKADAIW